MKPSFRSTNRTTAALLMVLACILFSVCRDVQAYEDSECLVCHKDYGRSTETIPERVSTLYVDQKQWEQDVHYEVAGLSCDDCHLDATPDTHPEEGLGKVNCGECHEEEVEGYYRTPHFTSEVEEGQRKPDCSDCHPPHQTRAKDDPESTVFKGNIKSVCLSCHPEIERSTAFFNRLAVFRISAHRKSDMSNQFDASECINCHHTEAIGHGENLLTEPSCGRCHASDGDAQAIVFGPFHLDPSWESRPLVFSAEVFNILMVVVVFVGLLIWVVRGSVKSKKNKATQQS